MSEYNNHCPHCGAPPGYGCISASGKHRQNAHAKRGGGRRVRQNIPSAGPKWPGWPTDLTKKELGALLETLTKLKRRYPAGWDRLFGHNLPDAAFPDGKEVFKHGTPEWHLANTLLYLPDEWDTDDPNWQKRVLAALWHKGEI